MSDTQTEFLGEELKRLQGEADRWRQECMAEEDRHTATKVELAKLEERVGYLKGDRRTLGLTTAVLAVGTTFFVILSLLYEGRARQYETAYNAADTLLKSCKQKQDQQPRETLDAVALENLCHYEDRYEETLGLLDQCKAALDPEPLNECRRRLNWREQKVDFGEWFAELQKQTDEKITTLRDQYFTLLEEFQPLKAKAIEMGLGPKVRDWINKPGATDLYIEVGERWVEIEQIYNEIEQVTREAENTANNTCYQNVLWQWNEILPDVRDHDRLQQEVFHLTNGNYFVYLYEQARAERNRAEKEGR